MNRFVKRSALATTTFVAFAAIATRTSPAAAAPACPTIAAVSAAIGSTATKVESEECAFSVGGDTISYTFVTTTDVNADVAARRADATSQTAPAARTKVGQYRAFTDTFRPSSHLTFDKKGTLVFLTHSQANARSADLLSRTALALSRINIPPRIVSCESISRSVVGTIDEAKPTESLDGSCEFRLSDRSRILVAVIDTQTFDESFAAAKNYPTGPAPKDVTVNGRHGFVFGLSQKGRILVLGLDRSIAVVETTTANASLPVKASKAIA